MKKLVCIPFDEREEMNRFLQKHIPQEDVVSIETSVFPRFCLYVHVYAGKENLKAINKHRKEYDHEVNKLYLITLVIGVLFCVVMAVLLHIFGG